MALNVYKLLDVLDIKLGNQLRQFRQAQDLTMRQLGERLEMSPQQISKYETGLNRISASTLWRLARALDICPTKFFESAEDMDIRSIRKRFDDKY